MKHFSIDEFRCPCCDRVEMRESTLKMLDQAREIGAVPFSINSGFRCPKHNEEVGGSEGSSHLYGWAADIKANTSKLRFGVVSGLVKAGFTRITVKDTFVHVDNDPAKPGRVMWK